MQMIFLVGYLLVMLIVVPVGAQDDNYRLHIPATDEYLSQLPEIWMRSGALPRMFDEEAYGFHMPEQLIKLMETTFLYRYADTSTTEQLIEAYETLNQGDVFGYANYMPFIDVQYWNLRIVQQWLDENPIGWQTVEQIEFDPYTIIVSRHHLTDTDEQDILLYVSRGDFVDHWLAVPENGTDQLVLTPVDYSEAGYWLSQPNGTTAEITVRDVNADGLDEMISKQWNPYPGSNYIGNIATLTVWGWREGRWHRMVSSQGAANPDAYSDIPQWQFENIDADTPLELIQNDYGLDNFYCLQHRRQVFDWNGEVYERIVDQTTFEETVGCALRFAQQAMWDHDYDESINFYELALARFSGDFSDYDGEQDSIEQFAAYAQERLFIAYMLAGDVTTARDMLDDLREQPLIDNTIVQQLIAIPEADLNALKVCETAYNFLNEEFVDTAPELNYRNVPNIGYIEENVHIYFMWREGWGSSERVACDLPYMHEQIAAMTASPPPTATRQPTATPDALWLADIQIESDLHSDIGDMINALRSGEMDNALAHSESVFDSPLVTPASDIALLIRHYRALALEALGRDAEALAEYVTIYEIAPESAWGMLAALYLERIER